jgi:uncharacterized membrane protein YdjX (TVP38/TMEM64 family)
MPFLSELKARLRGLNHAQWSAIGVIASFVLGVALLAVAYAFGGALLRLQGQDSVEALMSLWAQGPFAALGVMAIFSVLALVGMPQFILIAATVVVFGAWHGAVYSWIATMASALFGFVLGRLFARRMLERYGGARLNAASRFIADHGILSTAIVRNVPSAPFIVLNVAAGASAMSSAKFIIGTAIGILPKILFISLIGTGTLRLLTRWNPEDFFLIVAAAALWIGLVLVLRRVAERRRQKAGSALATPPTASAPPAPDHR